MKGGEWGGKKTRNMNWHAFVFYCFHLCFAFCRFRSTTCPNLKKHFTFSRGIALAENYTEFLAVLLLWHLHLFSHHIFWSQVNRNKMEANVQGRLTHIFLVFLLLVIFYKNYFFPIFVTTTSTRHDNWRIPPLKWFPCVESSFPLWNEIP